MNLGRPPAALAFWLASSWGSLFILVAITGFMHPSFLATALLSFVTGLQSGQSVAVQQGFSEVGQVERAGVLLLLGSAILLTGYGVDGSLLSPVLLLLGGAVGVVSGSALASLLIRRGSVAYHRQLTLRNLLVLSGVVGSSFAGLGPAATVSISVAPLGVIFALHNGRKQASSVGSGGLHVVLGGLAASLVYRNDLNWIRLAVPAEKYVETHIFLVFIQGLQAIVGVVLVHGAYRDRARFAVFARGHARAVAGSGFLLASMVGLSTLAGILGALLMVVPFLVAWVGIASGGMHTMGSSPAVYGAGLMGVAVLGVLIGLGVKDPGTLLGAEYSAIALLFVVVYLVEAKDARAR